MKRSPKEEIRRARIIFAVIVVVFLALLIGLIMLISGSVKKHSNKKDTTPSQSTESESISESEGYPFDPIAPGDSGDTEDTENTGEPGMSETEPGTEPETETESETEPTAKKLWVAVRSNTGLNLRKLPSKAADVLDAMPSGAEVEYVSEITKEGVLWYQITYNGQTGYAAAEYLTDDPANVRPSVSRVVCIDPGHQGKGDKTTEPNGPGSTEMKARVSSGTTGSFTKVPEYKLNLAVSLLLQKELESRGYTVYMTRTTHDVNISNMERAQYASKVGAEIAVRIHANGSNDASVDGASTLVPSSKNAYVSDLAEESNRLGKCIIDKYCAATGFGNRGVKETDTMTGINWSKVPVTIIEMGFMTNQSDDENMQKPEVQKKMAKGIADGIDAYFAV